MNKCSGCEHVGYKPDLPEHIHQGEAVPHLQWNDEYTRKYFKPLNLNENGYCKICEKSLLIIIPKIKKNEDIE